MYGAIERWRCVVWLGRKLLGFVAEKKVAACTGAGANFRKVRSIAVDVEMHFAGNKPYGGIRMGGTVVEELGDVLGCGSCSFGLGRRESTKSDKKCAVDDRRVPMIFWMRVRPLALSGSESSAGGVSWTLEP